MTARQSGTPATATDHETTALLTKAVTLRIGEPRYRMWFDRKTKLTWSGDDVVVGVPNLLCKDFLESKFGNDVRAAAAEVFGRAVAVRFVIDPQLFQAARKEQEAVERKSAASADVANTAMPAHDEPGLAANEPASTGTRPAKQRRWHHLSRFVVGPGNRLAHAAALSVVEAPGQNANPLVLHGPVGTGKTHLLEGIYVGLRKAEPDWRICFVTAEDFTNRFLQALRTHKLGVFRSTFRNCDALLMDNLHFLARKRATHEEFLHTFDALLADGKQVVVTGDCHPKLAEDFGPELADRLLGGAVWGLQPPDVETRLAILRSKVNPSELPVPEAVLRLLAEQLRGNVRELEGALNSVRHYSRVVGRPVDLDLTRAALAELLRHSARVVSVATVDQAVCRVLRLKAGGLQCKHRSWAVSHPRMLAMYLARKHTSAAYSTIGQHFGGRNHSTVVAAEKKVRQWLDENGSLTFGDHSWRIRDLIETIERELQV